MDLTLGAVRLHRLVLPLPLALREINVYLLEGPGGAALVDTGMNTPAARQALIDELQTRSLQPNDIGQVFITHLHLDHFGQADWLQGLGAQVVMSREDSERIRYWLSHPEWDGQVLELHRQLGAPADALERSREAAVQMRAAAPLFDVDLELEDGELLELCGEPFEVVITPGHTPGHACLHHRPTGTLILGDHVLPHITPNISVSHREEGDPLGAYRRSLRRVRGQGYTLGLPAHGDPIEDLDRRVDEILAHHDQREALLLDLMGAEPRSCYELTRGLFEVARFDGWETWMAMGETLAHLHALETTGQVAALQRGDLLLFQRQ